MDYRDEKDDKKLSDEKIINDIESVKNLAVKNRAAALGLAVLMTLSMPLTACTKHTNNEAKEEEDDTYYTSSSGGGGGYYGGSYYYSRGSSYNAGTWASKSISSSGKISYSASKGSIGG